MSEQQRDEFTENQLEIFEEHIFSGDWNSALKQLNRLFDEGFDDIGEYLLLQGSNYKRNGESFYDWYTYDMTFEADRDLERANGYASNVFRS